MKKSEMFDHVLDKVCETCEVDKASVMNGSKVQAVVDARILAIQYLRRCGFTNDDIALLVIKYNQESDCPDAKAIKCKAKSIDKAFKSYSERCMQSKLFRSHSYDISVILEGTLSDDRLKEYSTTLLKRN